MPGSWVLTRTPLAFPDGAGTGAFRLSIIPSDRLHGYRALLDRGLVDPPDQQELEWHTNQQIHGSETVTAAGNVVEGRGDVRGQQADYHQH